MEDRPAIMTAAQASFIRKLQGSAKGSDALDRLVAEHAGIGTDFLAPFTQSIDAALTLVPTWAHPVSIGFKSVGARATCLIQTYEGFRDWYCSAETVPLAIVAAALSARWTNGKP